MARFKKTGLNRVRTRYWFNKLFAASGKENIKQLAELFSGKDSNTSTQWKAYQLGKKIPDPYLNIVEQTLRVTKQDFIEGPNKLFSMMEMLRLNDVIKVALNELDGCLAEQGLPVLAETPDVFETHEEKAKWFIGSGKKVFNLKNDYDCSNLTPLALAFGHTESRMLGIDGAMADYIVEALLYMEEQYGIPPKAWSYDPDIFISVKHAIAKAKLNESFNKGKPFDQLSEHSEGVLQLLNFEKRFLEKVET